MQVKGLMIIALGCTCMCSNACNKTETIISGAPATAILINTSFELGGMPSLLGWIANSSDTSVVGFSTDIPPGGGRFSARILNAWSSAGGIRAAFPAPSGVHRYRLSAWARVTSQGLANQGSISIIVKTPDAMFYHKRFTFLDTTWTMHSLVDTVESRMGDSVIVSLAGDFSQFSGGWTLFDMCAFERFE